MYDQSGDEPLKQGCTVVGRHRHLVGGERQVRQSLRDRELGWVASEAVMWGRWGGRASETGRQSIETGMCGKWGETGEAEPSRQGVGGG